MAFAMSPKLTQPPSDYSPQIPLQDWSSFKKLPDTAESIVDSIMLLRDENDRLRRMAASLSVEAEDIRQSLSSTKSIGLPV